MKARPKGSTVRLILPEGEPFFFPGDNTGCLLLHGFTGAPKEMLWLGQHLAREGRTVFGPRLFAHATNKEDMKRARWTDWLADVEGGLDILQRLCRRIFVLGLSMGGVLALIAGARYDIDGVIAIAAPTQLPRHRLLRLARWLSPFVQYVPKRKSSAPESQAAREHLAYPVYPTRAIAELRKVLDEMARRLPEVDVPVLLINGSRDNVVSTMHQAEIAARLRSAPVETLVLEQSGHLVTLDVEHQRAFSEASKFIARLSGQAR